MLNTPLTPYIDKELLYNNNLFVDGSKIVKESGGKFTYSTKVRLLAAVSSALSCAFRSCRRMCSRGSSMASSSRACSRMSLPLPKTSACRARSCFR